MGNDTKGSKAGPQSHAEKPNPYKEITLYARGEIDWVRSAYKFAGALVAIVFAVGIAFTYKSSSDFRDETRQEAEKLTKQILERLSASEMSMRTKMDAQIAELGRSVQARVDDEFRADNIRKLIEAKAKERVDATADMLIKAGISERITPLRNELTTLVTKISEDNKVKVQALDQRQEDSKKTEAELRDLIGKAQRTLAEIRQQSEFSLAVLAAQSDDRTAFDKLLRWSEDASFPFRSQALAIRLDILKRYSEFLSGSAYLHFPWKKDFDSSRMTFPEIEDTWNYTPPQFARAYAEFVWTHTNVIKEQKLAFLHKVLTESRGSMQAADWAAKTLSQEANISYNPPFDFDKIEKWWAERSITNAASQGATNNVQEDTSRKRADPKH